jgi:hypothetical protein
MPEQAKTMPKDTHSAQRQDARLLVLLDDITHTEALQRLDADDGPAARARALVEEFHQAARARADRDGISVSKAKNALLFERELLPADSAFPLLRDDEPDWTALHGVHIRCERRLVEATRTLHGVALPPIAGRPPHQLRCALTAPARGRDRGTVITIDARKWHTDPSPETADDTAHGPRRCAARRPLYTETTLPAGILMTEPQLALRRLLPARGQAPIATLRTTRGRPSPLYAHTDATPIPAANAKQDKTVRATRTCDTCGAVSDTPFDSARDGKRYCRHHYSAAVARIDRAERARGRAVSIVWARRLMNDPTAALAVFLITANEDLVVHIESIDGNVQLHHTLPVALIPRRTELLLGQFDPTALPRWATEAAARGTFNKRWITSATEDAHDFAVALMSAAKPARRPTRHFAMSSSHDELTWRYRMWEAKTSPSNGSFYFEPDYLDRGARNRVDPSTLDAATLAQKNRQTITAMANSPLLPEEVAHAERYLASEPDRRMFGMPRTGANRAKLPADMMRVFGGDAHPTS